MSEKRRGLGRGLGALIPDASTAGRSTTDRPVDVWFRDQERSEGAPPAAAGVPVEAHQAKGADLPSSSGEEATPVQHEAAVAHADRSDALAPVPGASYGEIPLAAIRANPRQPRTVFDEDDLAELVHSITEIGVLQPIVVRRVAAQSAPGADESGGSASYELIMGERRWRASKQAGLASIPAIIKSTEDEDLLRDALLENLHRSDLNVLEEAAAYQQLLDDFGCSQEELSRRIGRSRPQISNTLRLLRLPPAVARRVAAGVLSAGHARALLTLDDGAQMERLAQRIVAEGLSVRSVEEIVSLGLQPETVKRSTPRAGGASPQFDDLAGRLSDRLDTRVKINLGQRKGRMTIEFASVSDLHRVLAQMGVEAHGEE